MKYSITGILTCLLFVGVAQLSADVVYLNDFGVEAERTAGAGGVWTETTEWGNPSSPVLYADNGFLGTSEDLDADGLHGTLYLADNGGTVKRWSQKLDAQDGFVFSNISISARGWGYATSQAAAFVVGLSDDGVTWDYETQSSGNLDYWAWATNEISASSGADVDYTGLTSVWISIALRNPNNAIQVSAPGISDVTVTADLTPVPEPASLAVLAFGGLLAVARKRRR